MLKSISDWLSKHFGCQSCGLLGHSSTHHCDVHPEYYRDILGCQACLDDWWEEEREEKAAIESQKQDELAKLIAKYVIQEIKTGLKDGKDS